SARALCRPQSFVSKCVVRRAAIAVIELEAFGGSIGGRCRSSRADLPRHLERFFRSYGVEGFRRGLPGAPLIIRTVVDGSRLFVGQILTGPLFNEPMRVEAVQANGPVSWTVGLVGTQSERFRKVTLTADDLSRLTILDARYSYDGDGRLLRLG